MRSMPCVRLQLIPAVLVVVLLLPWSIIGGAQGNSVTFSGQATAVHGMILGIPVTKSDTGPLPNSGGALEATLLLTSVPGRFGAEVLHASTVGQGDRSRSEATIADVSLPGSVYVEFIGAWAEAICTSQGPALTARSEISGLVINGQQIFVSGQPNQTIFYPGGRVIINEQTESSANRAGEITVNALHLIMGETTDFVICSAHADMTCRGNAGRGRDDFITGGGWMTGTPSRAKANFSVAGGIDDGRFWGHLTYVDHGPNAPRVSGTGVTAYQVVNNTTRHIEGTAEVNGQHGLTYQLDLTDNGEPGRGDIFALRLSNGYSARGTLGGGNIQIHRP